MRQFPGLSTSQGMRHPRSHHPSLRHVLAAVWVASAPFLAVESAYADDSPQELTEVKVRERSQLKPSESAIDHAIDLIFLAQDLYPSGLENAEARADAFFQRGLIVLEQHGESCWAATGWRRWAEQQLNQATPDLPFVELALEAAESNVNDCIPAEMGAGLDAFFEPEAGLLQLQFASFYRELGDQPGQLEALEQAHALLTAVDSENALDVAFRLVEFRHDLGDITDDGAGYDAILQLLEGSNHQLKLALNVHLCRAALAIDAGEPVVAIPHLEAILLSLEPDEDDLTPDLRGLIPMAYTYLALAELRQERRVQAEEYLKMAALYGTDSLSTRQVGMLLQVRGELLLAQHRPEDARALFRLVEPVGETEPELAWRALEGLSQVEQQEGHSTQSLAYLRKAVEGIDQQRRVMAGDTWILPYVSQRRRLYNRLLEQTLEAWQRESQPGNGAPTAATDRADALLALVEKSSALSFSAALLAEQGGYTPSGRQSLQLAQRLLTGERLDGRELRERLPAGETYYLYQPLLTRVLLLQVTREQVRPFVLPYEPVHKQLIRNALQSFRSRPNDWPTALDTLGDWLLSPIVGTLGQGQRQNPDQVVGIVLLGALEKLPLPALRVHGRPLISITALAEAPSLLVPQLLPSARQPETLHALGIAWGDDLPLASAQLDLLEQPGFSLKRLDDRPTAAQALHAMATDSPSTSIALQETAQALKSKTVSVQPLDLVMFATHAEPPAPAHVETGLDGVAKQVPAREAALLLSDRLTTSQLQRLSRQTLSRQGRSSQGLPLAGARVLLTTCESRVGDERFQEHSQGSLHRNFLLMGASSVMGSRWKVSDTATYVLTGMLLEELKSTRSGSEGSTRRGLALALARAQRRMLAGEGPAWLERSGHGQNSAATSPALSVPSLSVPSLSAPWSWAAFSVVGRMD